MDLMDQDKVKNLCIFSIMCFLQLWKPYLQNPPVSQVGDSCRLGSLP